MFRGLHEPINGQVGDLLTFTDTGVGQVMDMTAVFRFVDLSTGGSPINGSGDFRSNLRTTPEPSTYLMFGLGLATAAGFRYRSQRRRLALN